MSRRFIVLRYRYLGDTILSVPFFRQLRQAYPEATIDAMLASDSADLLRLCPYINDIHLVSKNWWANVGQLRQGSYDTAFVLKRSFSSAAMAWAAGIPRRIGFNTEGRGFFLTHRVPYAQQRHERDCFLDLLPAAPAPIHDDDVLLEAWWPAEANEAAAARLALAPPNSSAHVGIVLGSSNPAKQWPLAHWAQYIKHRWEATPHLCFHALGGPQDVPLAATLRLLLGSETQRAYWADHTGQTSLYELLALMQRMDAVVGVDSGPMHLAAAVGVPVTVLFGPMDPGKWAPISPLPVTIHTQPLACRPCHLKIPCPHDFACMQTLAPAALLSSP
jgi:heptosyltransferase-2